MLIALEYLLNDENSSNINIDENAIKSKHTQLTPADRFVQKSCFYCANCFCRCWSNCLQIVYKTFHVVSKKIGYTGTEKISYVDMA